PYKEGLREFRKTGCLVLVSPKLSQNDGNDRHLGGMRFSIVRLKSCKQSSEERFFLTPHPRLRLLAQWQRAPSPVLSRRRPEHQKSHRRVSSLENRGSASSCAFPDLLLISTM